jgi:phosphoribosylaminoimidazole-succinocarboxamide synthase
MKAPLFSSEISGLKLLFRGKVRDIYDLDPFLLVVTTDRVSAFDVVLPTPIPDKGRVLTAMTRFWLKRLSAVIQNHLIEKDLSEFISNHSIAEEFRERSLIVHKARPLPIEAIVRGYLAGSGYKEYVGSKSVCGISLPEGLMESSPLPHPIFTPSTKAEIGNHDENISLEEVERRIGKELSQQVQNKSLELYQKGAEHAKSKGIIIADTKFEFGLYQDRLILIDEVLTPDSSRFWPKDLYQPGHSQPSFDKQFIRDYLTSIGWNKKPPAPELPPEIVQKTSEKYKEALYRITGFKLP